MKAKEERLHNIRNAEASIVKKVPFAQRSRMLTNLRQEQSKQDSLANAESGSVG